MADWSPAIDVLETDQEYAIDADLPDVRKDDIRVTFEKGVLTIEGERRLDNEDKDRRYHRLERSYGTFARRFVLPGEVGGPGVKADFKDGVLSVRLPKSKKASPRCIDIKLA